MNRILLAAVLVVGCGVASKDAGVNQGAGQLDMCLTGSLGQAINSTGPVPEGCVKIEGGKIGVAPQTLTLADGISVTIDSWRTKDGSAGEFIGFTFSSSAPVDFAVKAATRTFASSSNTWTHPDGTGSKARAISNITFCPGAPPATDGGIVEGPGDVGDAGTPTTGGECGGGGSDGGIDENGGQPGEGCSADEDCTDGYRCSQSICIVIIN